MAVVRGHVENPCHVGVLERGSRSPIRQEAGSDRVALPPALVENLDGDGFPELDVAAFEDGGEGALTEARANLVGPQAHSFERLAAHALPSIVPGARLREAATPTVVPAAGERAGANDETRTPGR